MSSPWWWNFSSCQGSILPPSEGASFLPLVFRILLFWPWSTWHDHRWGSEFRWAGKLRALLFWSPLSSPQQIRAVPSLLLTKPQSVCLFPSLWYSHLWTQTLRYMNSSAWSRDWPPNQRVQPAFFWLRRMVSNLKELVTSTVLVSPKVSQQNSATFILQWISKLNVMCGASKPDYKKEMWIMKSDHFLHLHNGLLLMLLQVFSEVGTCKHSHTIKMPHTICDTVCYGTFHFFSETFVQFFVFCIFISFWTRLYSFSDQVIIACTGS